MHRLLFTPLAVLLLALTAAGGLSSCASKSKKPAAKKTIPRPTTPAAWRAKISAIKTPASRTDFGNCIHRSVPVKGGKFMAAYYFLHSSEPKDYEFYKLGDDAFLMLQVRYKTPAAPTNPVIEPKPVQVNSPPSPQETTFDTMEGVSPISPTPSKEDTIESAQLVLSKEIKFLGIPNLGGAPAKKQ